MSFIKEVKRRNVIRVAIAYAIVGWLLVEVASVVLPTLLLPDWTLRILVFFVILGFPLALVFAWAFELTPEGLKKEKDVDRSESITQNTGRKLDFAIIGLLAIAVVFLVVDNYVLRDKPAAVVAKQTELAVQPAEKSIAVLPFVNMSPDPDQAYFSDGLSEEILNLLAKIPELKVTGRTSSFAFKGKNEDLRGIGKALGVKTVLEGSVRRDGNQIRVTTQLINTADGYHLWSETYDRELINIFSLQDEIAQKIISALQVELGVDKVPSRGHPTENMQAYGLYLQAMERMRLGGQGFPDAVRLASEAIELDPDFAEAYQIKAVASWSDAGVGVIMADGLERAKAAAEKALALKPDLLWAETILLGSDPPSYDRLVEMEAQERLIKAQPSNSKAKAGLIYNLLFLGYLSEARLLAEDLIRRDPLYPAGHGYLGSIRYAQGDLETARREWEITRELGFVNYSYYQAFDQFMQGNDRQAIDLLIRDLRYIGWDVGNLPETLTKVRAEQLTGEQLRALLDADPVWNKPRWYWMFFAVFGYMDELFEILEDLGAYGQAQNDAETPLGDLTIIRAPGFLADARFVAIAEAYGMADIWRKRGAPDYCKPAGDSWACE